MYDVWVKLNKSMDVISKDFLKHAQRMQNIPKPKDTSLQSLPANGDCWSFLPFRIFNCELNIIKVINFLINTSREHFFSYPHMLNEACHVNAVQLPFPATTTQVLGRLCRAGAAMSPRSSHQRSEHWWKCWCLDTTSAPYFWLFLLISACVFYLLI